MSMSFPEDIYNQKKIEKLFSMVEFGCFQGHTHVPGVFTESRNFMTPDEMGYSYRFEQQKFMCNVGSVGQPRDGDPRPCYVIQEPEQLTFRRVDYDPTSPPIKSTTSPTWTTSWATGSNREGSSCSCVR